MPRGISTSGDVLATTLDGVSLDQLWTEFIAVLNTWNSSRSPIANLFTENTTLPGVAQTQATEGDDFEEASEFGKPKALRADATPKVMGLPLRWFDSAIRYTEGFLRDAPTTQVQAQHNAAMEADNRLVFKTVMRALFDKPTLANRPVNEGGATIYPLWDGESDAKPPAYAGHEFAPGHNHYLTTGSADLAGTNLAALVRTITEHGYGVNGSERIVVLMNPNQGEVVRGFRVSEGDPFDFIPSTGAPAYLTNEQIVGEKPPANINGLEVIGSFGKALLVEDYHIPNNYLVATATGSAPLAFRQHARAEYQGLRIIPGLGRHPLVESTYARGFGVGVQRRGAAAVLQVKESGPYDVPTI